MTKRFKRGLSALGITLGEGTECMELKYLDELLRWNEKINLTSIRDRGEAIEKHLLDSLSILPYVGNSSLILDIGSGGGLPGIPLAIANRYLRVTSVDSVGKKINFQRHIKRLLHLDNLQPEHVRIEDLGSRGVPSDYFDVAVTRAFSSLETIIAQAVSWVAPGGKIIAMKGPEGIEEVERLNASYEKYEIDPPEIHSYRLPFSDAERHIVIAQKKKSPPQIS